MTSIAEMVEAMLAKNVEPALIVLAVHTAEASRDASRSVTVSNRSRAAMRAARYRKNRKQKQALAKANDVAKTGAEMQHQRRDASRDGVTGHCDISSLLSNSVSGIREVKEEKKQTEIVALAQKKVSRETRGTRMTATAGLSDADRQFARDQGMDAAAIDKAWAEFKDYWIAIPGQRGTKLDWSATWRNRVRQVSTKHGGPNGHKSNGGARQSGGADFFAGLAEVAADIAGDGGMAGDSAKEVPLGRVNIDHG